MSGYVQCPSCRTIFKVAAEQLDAHHGLVRCGRCQDVFNGTWNLVDELPGTGDVDALAAGPQVSSPVAITDAGEVSPEGVAPVAGPRGGSSDADEAPAQSPAGSDVADDGAGAADGRRRADRPPAVEKTVTLPAPILKEIESAAEQVSSLDDNAPPADTRAAGADSSVDGGAGVAEPVADPGKASRQPYSAKVEDAAADDAPPPATDDRQSLSKARATVSVAETGPGTAQSAGDAGQSPADRETAADSADTRAGGAQADPNLEEIVIEAPPNLWNAFGDSGRGEAASDSQAVPPGPVAPADRSPDPETDRLEAGLRSLLDPVTGSDEPAAVEDRTAAGDSSQDQAAASSAGRSEITREMVRPKIGQDVRLVEIPRPRPLQTIAWTLATLFLLGAIGWQLKQYYLNDLAQYPALRPYLTKACEFLECNVPPRSAFKLIDLVGTSVNAHPHAPGALRVSVNLVNRAQFEQRYPPLEITLTDTGGRVVGRRTYAPEEYLADASKLLPPSVIQQVDLDLAQPSETAIGYEIQLVKR